jgi:hypothetical protein
MQNSGALRRDIADACLNGCLKIEYGKARQLFA